MARQTDPCLILVLLYHSAVKPADYTNLKYYEPLVCEMCRFQRNKLEEKGKRGDLPLFFYGKVRKNGRGPDARFLLREKGSCNFEKMLYHIFKPEFCIKSHLMKEKK